jgi:hypothetical protein
MNNPSSCLRSIRPRQFSDAWSRSARARGPRSGNAISMSGPRRGIAARAHEPDLLGYGGAGPLDPAASSFLRKAVLGHFVSGAKARSRLSFGGAG